MQTIYTEAPGVWGGGRNLGGLSRWIRRKKNRRGIKRKGRRVGERGVQRT